MVFIKYPSLTNSDTIDLDHYALADPRIKWQATEKIHGMNVSIAVEYDGNTRKVSWNSRNRTISGGEAAETPQPYTPQDGDILTPLPEYNGHLLLPKNLDRDVQAAVNAMFHLFLFHGEHGTGKTETVKLIAQNLGRKPYVIEVANLLTDDPTVAAGNIVAAFQRINSMLHPGELVILLHGIDILLQDDSYQAGIIRSALLSQIDELDENVVLFAETTGDTTDLASHFDATVEFQYDRGTLCQIAEKTVHRFSHMYSFIGEPGPQLVHDMFATVYALPAPGEIVSFIRMSIAFANPNKAYDYLRRIYKHFIEPKASIDCTFRFLHDLIDDEYYKVTGSRRER